MPHEPGHVFDPYNLSPEEEKSRRLLRQAEDALAPAAMRGQLGERGPLQEFLIEQADEIKNITGAKRARITNPEAFGAFLAGRSDEFEEFTGQPSPMRQAMAEEDRGARGRPDRPELSKLVIIPGVLPARIIFGIGEQIGRESFAQLAGGFQPGNIGPLNLGGPTLQIGPDTTAARARELEAQGMNSFMAATQALQETRGDFPDVTISDLTRLAPFPPPSGSNINFRYLSLTSFPNSFKNALSNINLQTPLGYILDQQGYYSFAPIYACIYIFHYSYHQIY